MAYNPETVKQPTSDSRKVPSNHSVLSSIFRVFVGFLVSFLTTRILLELLRRWRTRRVMPDRLRIEREVIPVEPVIEPDITFVLPPESYDEIEFSYEPPISIEVTSPEVAGRDFSFDLPLTAAPPPTVADPYLSVPSNILVESYEPKYQFNWQNPSLEEDIYPFRTDKLVDFLAFYTEIDLLKEYHSKGVADPTIKAKIRQSERELRQERQEVVGKLGKAIDTRKGSDPYFARITGSNERNLRFKQTYYLDREIQRKREKLDYLEDRKATLLKRIDWYPPDDYHRDVWRERAKVLNPEIDALKMELADVSAFRELFYQEAELPEIGTQQITIEDVVRWEMREKRKLWMGKNQDKLLSEIINNWFRRDPDRFPEWLVYMLIHFSGMRYMSAHATWAEPRYLLELLAREDLESQINEFDPDQLAAQSNQAVQELQNEIKPPPNDPVQKSISALITRLQNKFIQKRALLEFRTSNTIEEIQKLPDDEACLKRLVQFKAEKDASGNPMPPWVWAEIVKYTPLRLNTDDPDWEAYSPERWKWTNRHWSAILNTWEQKDITSWRKKHRESLELVVTRAVCNEISEHIQHLRGITPAAGLTSKPVWYIRQADKDPQRAYFVQAPVESDFKSGASILWLDWVDREPNAWQVAHPLPGFDFFPGQRKKTKRGQKGEVRKKDLEKSRKKAGDWDHQQAGNTFIRTRRKASRQELKKQGKSQKEIRKIMANRKTKGALEKSYLRWTHEAIVIDVVDMADGRYVMTFETGKIGVILRRMSDLRGNPMVFVGYVPGVPSLPEELDRKLVDMLRWDRILPRTNLPPRVRPRPQVDSKPVETTPVTSRPGPQRPVLVIRKNARCWKVFNRDNQGRPKMVAARPPLKFEVGDHLNVSTNHKESTHDAGDGLVHARGGVYLRISEYRADRRAQGLFVRLKDVADLSGGKWVIAHPQISRINPQFLRGRDRKDKPFFAPAKQADRKQMQIPAGAKFRVSTSHTESDKDSGDGIILSTGREAFYLILECPTVPKAAGYYTETRKVVDTS